MSFNIYQIIEFIVVTGLIILAYPIFKAMLGAPFLPTPRKTSEKMLQKVKIKQGQIVYDLGCGDGRFVHMASRKYQAKGIGIELNPLVYLYAKLRSIGHSDELIYCRDFMKLNLSSADIIVCYLLPKTMYKLEKKLMRELKPGAKVISHGFKFAQWEPKHIFLPTGKDYGKIYLFEKK